MFYLHHKKIIIFFICLIFLCFCLFSQPTYHFSNLLVYFYDKNSIKCYRYSDPTLTDISFLDIRKGKSIFFHETSCNSHINGKISITSREACAVESAALLNPNLDVYLLYTSPGIFKFEGTESDRFLQALLSYENIEINHLDYEKYTRGTPLEKLYSEGNIEASQYAMSHASDVLRYLTLWKYGGIYLDLDIVVIKSLENLPPNFSGCESKENVAAGIIGFQPEKTDNGHKLVEECIMDLKHNFSGTQWGNNGPGVVTRLVKKHCKVKQIKEAFNRRCDDFKVFSPEYFYAIPWQSWKEYFEDKSLDKVMNATKKSYIIHVWNKHSNSLKLSLDSKSAYSTFAKKYCPKVYEQCNSNF
ncbi:hypothetical protein WA026_001445 [Henosepilachna vigintioctopunctata]|uniref:Alpha 1,4-glycosyltransferase domain-containing protein n=1 Tax=Henosepilachna vigintioctopunctata TaxID=420089 RepID=A0AAW1UUM0_9CUCU